MERIQILWGESGWRVRVWGYAWSHLAHGSKRPLTPLSAVPGWHPLLLWVTTSASTLWGSVGYRFQAKGRLWRGSPGNGLTGDRVRHWVHASSAINSSVNPDMQSQEGTSPTLYPERLCALKSDSSAILCKLTIWYFIQAEKHRKLLYGYWRNHYFSESYWIQSHLGPADIWVINNAT